MIVFARASESALSSLSGLNLPAWKPVTPSCTRTDLS